ncbi:hypothetical protein P3X46_006605 [Hevea brasiliensis]|uniref:Stigma-specific Stig1 family protein n=1 Tax=Hevea brasiliensis TaxID=3981 RepID=A0ABQ9MU19_HEVBR|nr:stigma-specific STIG1-like protein 1 [Hevea brasiliensis]KAJ9182631.1 hypothetical protein P3X46_006605 [Hevea brasiliensis]
MELTKIIFFIAITMAISITLTVRSIGEVEEKLPSPRSIDDASSSTTLSKGLTMEEEKLIMPSKRLSRFLAEDKRNPRAADHCHKDNEICKFLGGKNQTCCNNKCVDLSEDKNNCGACKNKCHFSLTCCRGQCVNLAYDKRHCGSCNNRCKKGKYCVYGMCQYA